MLASFVLAKDLSEVVAPDKSWYYTISTQLLLSLMYHRWMGEKYDGIRCIWNPIRRTFYPSIVVICTKFLIIVGFRGGDLHFVYRHHTRQCSRISTHFWMAKFGIIMGSRYVTHLLVGLEESSISNLSVFWVA